MAARPAEIDYVPVPLPGAAQPKRRAARSSARRAAYRSQSARKTAAPVKPLAPKQQLPGALRNLLLLQRGSSVVLLVLGVLTLGVYSRTVSAQRSWSSAFNELSLLRRQEPQLTLANEALKQHLADSAEQQDSGLVNPDPFNALFLEPAAPRSMLDAPEAVEAQNPQLEQPLSY